MPSPRHYLRPDLRLFSDDSCGDSSPRPCPRHTRRGFTLLEVMTVLVIIGILLAMAMPQFVDRMRDRRTNQAAQEISLLYRTARARALGRGAAQLVRYVGGANPQTFTLLEAVQPIGSTTGLGSAGQLPVSSCLTTNWTSGATTNRQLTSFSLTNNGNGVYAYVSASLTDAIGVQPNYDVCFTPSGRSYYQYNPGSLPGALLPLLAVPTITVQRTDGSGNNVGLTRTVLLPPNGASRLAL